MRTRLVLGSATGVFVASFIAYFAARPAPAPEARRAAPPPPPTRSTIDDAPPKLPETLAPEGLPIITWGKRDHFPVIRKPRFFPARQGDAMLAPDEPVLGLAVNGDARAYSTNQLNRHEMVLDEVGGVPVLVTY